MKRTIILTAFAALILGVALGVWAQATVNLWPADLQVSVAKKTTAVVACCYVTGYQELDGEGNPVDPAITWNDDKWITSYAWTDNPAMLAWYKSRMINQLQTWRAEAWKRSQTQWGSAPEWE